MLVALSSLLMQEYGINIEVIQWKLPMSYIGRLLLNRAEINGHYKSQSNINKVLHKYLDEYIGIKQWQAKV